MHPSELSQEEFFHKIREDNSWRDFTIDTRSLRPGAVFFALRGEFSNGHSYISHAMKRGAKAVVLNNLWFSSHRDVLTNEAKMRKISLVPVDNVLACLQGAGSMILKQYDTVKIGITGSSGKTTTKDLLACALSAAHSARSVGSVYYTEGNYNSVVGVPIVLAHIPAHTDYIVLEMGISELGEMQVLNDMIMPDHALLTGIGTAHLGRLGSVEHIVREKFRIFSTMNENGIAVIPKTNSIAMHYLNEHPLNCRVLFYGLTHEFGFSLLEENIGGSRFSYAGHTYRLPAWGQHQLHNAAGVITMATALGLSPQQINEGFAFFRIQSGRGNIIRGASVLIDDSYNANPESMRAAFASARSIAEREHLQCIFILGDMKELGDTKFMIHRDILDAALDHHPAEIALIGDDFPAASQRLSRKQRSRVRTFPHIDELRTWLKTAPSSGMLFLIKASRSMGLERLIGDVPGVGVGGADDVGGADRVAASAGVGGADDA
ncbi:MAG: UDP-N-acetylmuramoyl-tripeptide--D-alanyl-D-alanine ligase [Salinispira sp.]